MAKPKPYVNNPQLFAVLKTFHAEVVAWRKAGDNGGPRLDKPRIPEYVGQCLWMLCNRLSRRYNFVGYSFRDEMCGDAIENCVAAVDNFDPRKSKNPFGYFSLIAWRAMVRRIVREQRQTYAKIKNFENMYVLDETGEFRDLPAGGPGDGTTRTLGNEFTDEFVKKFEASQERRRRPRKKKTVRSKKKNK